MLRRDSWLFLSVCIISLLQMLPRILSAQFGLLDDGILLLHAQQSINDPSSILYQFQDAGRFLPTALLLRMLMFSFAGFDPQRWYILSTFFLIVLCLEMASLARQYGFTRMQALLSVLIFLISPTLIENFYTLSKSEIPLLFLISSAIFLATRYRSSDNNSKKTLIVVFCSIFLLFGFGAKETAIVLPFLFLSWIAISWIYFRKTGNYQDSIQTDAILLAGSLLGCAVYWIIRSILGIGDVSSYSGGYQLFNIEKLLFNFKALLGWLIRDYSYLLPMLLAILLVRPLRQTKITFFALRWFSWMGAWSLILLPWNYLSYYLLPFSFGSALFSGMILGQMLTLLMTKDSSYSKIEFEKHRSIARIINRIGLYALCITSFVLLIPPVFNATTYATEQLVFDRANWQFIEQVVKLPLNSRVLVNLPSREEYFFEVGLFVQKILNRPDISIEAYQPPILLDKEQNIYLASPIFINQVLPRVRALHGIGVMEWRGCLKGMTDDSMKVFSVRVERPFVDIGLHRLLVFLNGSDMIGYSNRDIIARTSIIYGWDLWRFPRPSAQPARAGVYRDGVFILPTQTGDFQSIPFGQGNETPLTGDINGDGFTDLIIYNKHLGTWMVDHNLDGDSDQTFNLPGMQVGDMPLIGDWDGDREDTFGFFRASDVSWHLYDSFTGQATNIYHFGEASDIPIAGDWNGDGRDETGIYRPRTGYTLLLIDPHDLEVNPSLNGVPEATPIVASWDGMQRDTLAFVTGNTWTIYPFNTTCYPANPLKSFQLEYKGVPLAINGWLSE